MAPIALMAGGQWRALFAAAGSALILALASAMMFGVDTWIIWLHQTVASLIAPSAQWIEYGRMWGYSVWTCAVLLGATPMIASVLQLAVMLFAGGAVAVAFRPSSECVRQDCGPTRGDLRRGAALERL